MKRILTSMLIFAAMQMLADKAYIGIYVMDGINMTPVSGAKIVASFEDDIGWRAWTESPRPVIAHGITDINGFCRCMGKTNCGRSSCWIDCAPEGYYRPPRGGSVKYAKTSIFGVWQPEDVVVTVTLQRVGHPIPLHVHRVQLKNPKNGIGGFDGTNAVLRYDFMVGDWLPPHGNGKHSDMTIRTHLAVGETLEIWRRHPITFYDFVSSVEFGGVGNGLVEKMVGGKNLGLKIRNAPESGYSTQKEFRFGRRKQERKYGAKIVPEPEYYCESDKDRCYCFRIRSKFDGKGKLVEAYYGKIYGDFQFEGWIKSGLCGVDFLYYLNPTPLDRNLEWDMKNNLCPNPGSVGLEP